MNLGAQLGPVSITIASSPLIGLAKWAPFIALNFCCLGLHQVKPTPLDLRSSSRPMSIYWGQLRGLKGMFVTECPENPGNTCTCIGSIANIYSLCNLGFNLAIKTVNVGLC